MWVGRDFEIDSFVVCMEQENRVFCNKKKFKGPFKSFGY